MIYPKLSQVRVKSALLAAFLFLFTVPRLFAEVPAAELIKAIQSGDQKKLSALLKQGADPNAGQR